MPIIKGYMVPHPPLIVEKIGRGSEKKVQKTIDSYREIADDISKIEPETIVITSPHALIYSDAFYIANKNYIDGSFAKFGAQDVQFKEEIDTELVNKIIENAKKEKIIIASGENELDHGVMVPLYFIRKKYPKSKIIVMGYSFLSLSDNYKMGMIINKSINELNRKVVFVASGDLSHKLKEYGPYGFIEEGPIYDDKIMNTMSKANFNELLEYDEEFLEKAAECGHRSFTMLAGALDGYKIESKMFSHEDTTGVGYGICSFDVKEKDNKREFLLKYLENEKEKINSNDVYVNLAKETIRKKIEEDIKIEGEDYNLPELVNEQAGVFVSIHKFKRLRGCIGTISPIRKNIKEEIINNAISAATNDPRFPKVEPEELDYLEVNVDVLKTPEPIKSKDELDIKKYGVIVTSGYKRGLLLPDIDGINSVDEQIEIAMKKGNISKNDDIKLERFEVVRHK